MNTPKPRIRPKSESNHGPTSPRCAIRPPIPSAFRRFLTERDPGAEQNAAGRVIFHEDDCLR